jgi:hypothetical protein
MSYKLRPRLGSAIASTILSYAAVSLAGVDQAQAAVLAYNFQVQVKNFGLRSIFSSDIESGSFKVSDSSVTGIGVEEIAVSEGRFYGFTLGLGSLFEESKEYYDLAGAKAVFYQGVFRGLNARGTDQATTVRQVSESVSVTWRATTDWDMFTLNRPDPTNWKSVLFARESLSITPSNVSTPTSFDQNFLRDRPIIYTLVDTQPEPVREQVPEPLTAGGTVLALAGLSWLKHKKKMAA